MTHRLTDGRGAGHLSAATPYLIIIRWVEMMKTYPLGTYCDPPDTHFEYPTAAHLARVSISFIHKCERSELISSHTMLHGKKGLCVEDVVKLKVIRHFHEDMGLELEAVAFILSYRSQIKRLQSRLKAMQHRLHRHEQNHRIEILQLRQQVPQAPDTE